MLNRSLKKSLQLKLLGLQWCSLVRTMMSPVSIFSSRLVRLLGFESTIVLSRIVTILDT